MAYRSRREAKTVQAADSGLVVDMVRQFADRYAFVRELVQNAVDASATGVQVRATLEPGGAATFSVHDDGEGMSRETIEGPLLTLFNSSKDDDSSKIGKYGVGFVSVFALEPEEVLVETSRGAQAWLLRLLPDHSYELARARPQPASGTRVALRMPVQPDQFAEHVDQMRAALRRWCRHAGLPITLSVSRPEDGGRPATPERIDRPLAVPSPVWIERQVGGATYVLGPSAGAGLYCQPPAAPTVAGGDHGSHGDAASAVPAELEDGASFAGFYNRGLTLYETTQPLSAHLAGLRVKVLSPHLQHTLSRDNVRRDEAFVRAMRQLHDLGRDTLPAVLAQTLDAAARAAAAGEDPGRYAALVTAACAEPCRLPLDEIACPLVHPVGGRPVLSLEELAELGGGAVHAAEQAGELTKALAADHRPVLHAVHSAQIKAVASRLDAARLQHVDRAFVLARTLDLAHLPASDQALCTALAPALHNAGAKLDRVALAEVLGAAPPRGLLAVPAAANRDTHLRSLHEASTWWTRWGAAPTLLLLDRHPAVRRARALAEYHPGVAAQLLARALVVEERGALSKRASDRLLGSAPASAPPSAGRRRQ